jgi:hypothetical protein
MNSLKKILSFVSKWSDVLALLPIALIVFLFNGSIIRALDPTASILSVEFLSILNFNIVVFASVMSGAYFIYNLFFHDFFKVNWEDKMSGVSAGAIHVILWLSSLAAAFKIITHNL